ncbi:MAG: Lrp/AsnC family transcriptional regulator [Nanoarchaeota archaeon]|nr:Lrp/AsnC family transcriptional regulator [Nanoarchaeota archaeon]MBU1320827.1 Lrp/AsnC family transcriptional regulator [Nanoarchaeota archaeon]MBU1596837.1 Lrp/AsnC family transcriptional regulator [Nanoarchaeota archaeon]MBU2440905.1 Lrp/AsnC family transcriptional regulator [Nanoarchaeota archaeon]
MRYLQQNPKQEKIKLDIKDKKILALMSHNSRDSYTHIAKKVGLSRDAAKYRINKLTKAGLIQGYRTLIDINKLGYDAYHLFIKLNNLTPETEKEIIEKWKSYPFMRAIIKYVNGYDFELAVIAKSVNEFERIQDQIMTDTEKYLQEYDVLIITRNLISRSIPATLIDEIEEEKTQSTTEKIKIDEKINLDEINLDKKDQILLKDLAEDASIPIYKLAEKTKLSPDAVTYRIRKLIKQGLIIKFMPVLNYSILSYDIYAVLFSISGLTQEKESKLKELLKRDKNMLWAVKTIGKYNLLVYICIDNTEELHKSLINLRNNFPTEIKKCETMLAYEEYKYIYLPEIVFS